MKGELDWRGLRRAAVSTARSVGLSRAEAEDVAQDALVEMLKPRAFARGAAVTYVQKTAYRIALRALQARLVTGLEPDDLAALVDAEPAEPEQEIRDRLADGHRALASLGTGLADARLWGGSGKARMARCRLRERLAEAAAGTPQGLKAAGPTAENGAPTRRSGSRNFFSDGSPLV